MVLTLLPDLSPSTCIDLAKRIQAEADRLQALHGTRYVNHRPMRGIPRQHLIALASAKLAPGIAVRVERQGQVERVVLGASPPAP